MQRNAAHSAHSIHIRLTFIAVTRYFIGLAEAYNPGLPNWNEYTGCVGSAFIPVWLTQTACLSHTARLTAYTTAVSLSQPALNSNAALKRGRF